MLKVLRGGMYSACKTIYHITEEKAQLVPPQRLFRLKKRKGAAAHNLKLLEIKPLSPL
jgi:hypothetical protein